jgi:hypothetical protein
MKMKISALVTLALSAVALSLAYYLGDSIYQEQQKFELIKISEIQTKSNLKGLREAQVIHKRKYGFYAKNWKVLTQFLASDSLVITDASEKIIPRQYQNDSIITVIDTVEIVAVTDSLFNRGKYPFLDKSNLKKIPLQEHYFVMKINNNFNTSFLYIADEQPLDEMRRKPIIRNDKPKRIKGTKPLLSIGSTKDESIKVSWTK